MKEPSQEELAETYTRLNSEELLELYASGTLTRFAELVARKELKRRGITGTPEDKKTYTTVTSETSKLENFLERILAVGLFLGGILAIGFFVGTTVIIWYQTYILAKTGTRLSIPISSGLEAIGMNLDAIYQPTDWYGLAVLARWFLDLPLAIAYFLVGLLLIALRDWFLKQ